MARFTTLVLGTAVFSISSALPTDTTHHRSARAQAVVDAFKTSWEGYYTYAFPNDELKPVTNGFSNSR